MVLMTLYAGQQWRDRHREQTYGHSVGGTWKERVRCMERVTRKYIRYAMLSHFSHVRLCATP